MSKHAEKDNDSPNIAALIDYFKKEKLTADEAANRMQEALRSYQGPIKEIFFEKNAQTYLPMLNEERKNNPTYNTLTSQVERASTSKRTTNTSRPRT